MDKHLRPPRFSADPNTASAEKEWKHWFRTFENFLASIADQNPDKLVTLTNYVTSDIFEHIADSASYNSAVNTLKALYVKQKNEVYNRHVLASRRQREGETLDQYIQELTKLSKECTFVDVTAIQYCSEYIRDAFINGIQSKEIRQRLLENATLTKDEAFRQARSLEMAQKQSTQYLSSSSFAASVTIAEEPDDPDDLAAVRSNRNEPPPRSNEKCYFCGGDRHPRQQCPARDALCNTCGIAGHWSRVCRSRENNNNDGNRSPCNHRNMLKGY
jgi:hypothetical protein